MEWGEQGRRGVDREGKGGRLCSTKLVAELARRGERGKKDGEGEGGGSGEGKGKRKGKKENPGVE